MGPQVLDDFVEAPAATNDVLEDDVVVKVGILLFAPMPLV
jgi:hypothetical protein